MWIDLIQSIAVVFVFAGVWCISIPQIKGQWYMLIAQTLWIIYAFLVIFVKGENMWPLAVQSVVLFLINIKAIVNWRRKRIGS